MISNLLNASVTASGFTGKLPKLLPAFRSVSIMFAALHTAPAVRPRMMMLSVHSTMNSIVMIRS